MDSQERYRVLEDSYVKAMKVCDPIEYNMRQQFLLRTIACYLLERDKPQPIETKNEQTI